MTSSLANVIGDPIAQSKSPIIHGFWLQKLAIAGKYTHAHVSADGLADYLNQAKRDPHWMGCNVTMPHKQAIIPLLETLDPLAERLGAVNTVLREKDGSLKGYNTDVGGFLEPLHALLEKQHVHRTACILGTGGAARAIIAALAAEGFTLVVAGRDPQKARSLLDELTKTNDHRAVHLDHFAKPIDFGLADREDCLDLIINASPLGMTGNPPLVFDWSHAPTGAIVYDIVTSPAVTSFLQAAQDNGYRTVGGFAMLIGQAALAFERFYGHPPPRKYDRELEELLTA